MRGWKLQLQRSPQRDVFGASWRGPLVSTVTDATANLPHTLRGQQRPAAFSCADHFPLSALYDLSNREANSGFSAVGPSWVASGWYASKMNQILNIVIGNGPVWQVNASETGLGPSPQLQTPENIAGKLVDLSFEGASYRFTRLEKDGSFQLQRQ